MMDRGEIMQAQLHTRLNGDIVDFNKVEKCYKEPILGGDRIGGFWTSSYNEEYGSDWLQKKMYKPHIHVFQGYLYKIKDGVKIYNINNFSDEQQFKSFYKSDYNEVAKDFHCLHLNHEYLNLCANEYNYHTKRSNFYLWFVECTWWFNTDYLILDRIIDGSELSKMANIKIY